MNHMKHIQYIVYLHYCTNCKRKNDSPGPETLNMEAWFLGPQVSTVKISSRLLASPKIGVNPVTPKMMVLHTEKHIKNSTENGFTYELAHFPAKPISSLFSGQWLLRPQLFDAFYSNHLDPLHPKLSSTSRSSFSFPAFASIDSTFACGEAHQSRNYTPWKTNTPPPPQN